MRMDREPNARDEARRRGGSVCRIGYLDGSYRSVGGHHAAQAERPGPACLAGGRRRRDCAGRASAAAQQARKTRIKPIVRPVYARAAFVTSGSGPYYIEFRSRYAWDYGHTYIVYGRVGETPTKASVAGLSPVGDDATAWVIGHYVPVPAETGWTDGDLEDKYMTARYRVLMSKDEYDRDRRLYQGSAKPVAYVERGTL